MNYSHFAAFLFFASLSIPLSAAEPQPVTIDDFAKIKGVGSPTISTDGEYVAYVSDKQIHIVGLSGGESRPVTSTASAASDPCWSKDGKSLYFLSNRSGTQQVWKLPLTGFGEAMQVTEIERGVDTLRFSHDESRLLLSYDDPAEEKADDDKEKGPWVITRLQFKRDAGDGYLTERPSDHIYIYDVASRDLAQVTAGNYAEGEAAWSPDGEHIVFVSSREKDPDVSYKNDLWVVPARANDEKKEDDGSLLRLTASDDVKSSPAWSPDGKWIAYLTAVDGVYGINRLAVIPAGGGTPAILTAQLDRWVQAFRFSADGRWIYFLFDNRGGQHLARVRVTGGEVEHLLGGERNVSAFDVDDSGHIVVRLTDRNDADNLYRLRNDRLDRLTSVNDDYLSTRAVGGKEKISFASPDGTEVEAFVTKPPGFTSGRRYPTILDIHGGPVGQFSWGYDFGAQFLAANGYVVVQPNPRGSTGRGQDYVRAIYQTWGITDYEDVIAAVDHVIELGIADPERLAVTGYSYGGYMTNIVITRTDRFKAAASGAGHSFIAANYGHDIYQRWYNWELGVPWENADKYARLSPLLKAGEVETPTIFLGGREDWNVPILNSELFYQSLRQRGIATQLVVYPDTHHGGWEERFDKDFLQRVVAWFDRYAKAR